MEPSAPHPKTQGPFTAWPGAFRKAPVSVALATWFGTGFLPIAPGTWGSAVAIPFVELSYRLLGLAGIAIFALAVSAAGVVAAGRAARARGVEDPSEVVIDEVAGQALALLGVYAFCPMTHRSPVFLAMVALAFLVFRVVDVVKPGPVGAMERLPGGLGVMADDLLGGLLTGIALGVVCLLLWRQ